MSWGLVGGTKESHNAYCRARMKEIRKEKGLPTLEQRRIREAEQKAERFSKLQSDCAKRTEFALLDRAMWEGYREVFASELKRKSSDIFRKHAYGITPEWWDQHSKFGCEICGRLDRLNVDHDHRSGHVRGVLCWFCNILLGRVEQWDLDRAFFYLERKFDDNPRITRWGKQFFIRARQRGESSLKGK